MGYHLDKREASQRYESCYGGSGPLSPRSGESGWIVSQERRERALPIRGGKKHLYGSGESGCIVSQERRERALPIRGGREHLYGSGKSG